MTEHVERRRQESQGPGHGGPARGEAARGYSWPAFEPGNRASLTHGAYATLHLRPRAQEIAAALRELVPEERFGLAVESAGMVGARVEAAFAALADAGPDELRRLDQDARGWTRLWLAALGGLGLTPRAAASILRDRGVGRAAASSAALRELHSYLEAEHEPREVEA